MAHHRRVALLCVALLARARGLLPPRPRARRLTVPRASPGPESLARDAEDAGRRRRERAAENAAPHATLQQRQSLTSLGFFDGDAEDDDGDGSREASVVLDG